MQIPKLIRRSVASVILTAGLAYPVCAAVCPKGIGGCPSPGRCFLFVDADGNSLCDYTSRAGLTTSGSLPSKTVALTQTTTAPVPDPTAAPTVTSGAPLSPPGQVTPVPATAPSVVPDPAASVLFPNIPVSMVITEAVLFFLVTGIIFAVIRSGIFGVKIEKSLPALVLSSLFGLGLSLVATSLLSGGSVAAFTYALIFMGAGSLIAGYLWYAGVMKRRVVVAAAVLGTFLGFVFGAPIMPTEIGSLVNIVTGASAVTTAVLVICAVIVLTLIAGRTFCGNICPVGSLQEVAYSVPVRKIPIRRTTTLELVRLAVFVATVAAAVSLIDLMAVTGLYDLFSLTLSAGFIIAAGLMFISLFLYRPVCRVLCPFGVLFSIPAEFSFFRLHRTESCISCRKCEKACPTRSAGKDGSKRECYLCGRCTDVCPVEGGMVFSKG